MYLEQQCNYVNRSLPAAAVVVATIIASVFLSKLNLGARF